MAVNLKETMSIFFGTLSSFQGPLYTGNKATRVASFPGFPSKIMRKLGREALEDLHMIRCCSRAMTSHNATVFMLLSVRGLGRQEDGRQTETASRRTHRATNFSFH